MSDAPRPTEPQRARFPVLYGCLPVVIAILFILAFVLPAFAGLAVGLGVVLMALLLGIILYRSMMAKKRHIAPGGRD